MYTGAAFYGNEAVVGEGLAGFLASGKRSELFITSKVWNTHHKPADSRYVCMYAHRHVGVAGWASPCFVSVMLVNAARAVGLAAHM